MKTIIYVFDLFRSFLLRMRNVSDKSCRENQNKHFMFNNFFFSKIVLLITYVEQFCRTGQVTGNMLTVFPQDTGIQSRSTR